MSKFGIPVVKKKFLFQKMSLDSAIENKTIFNKFPIFSIHIFTPMSRCVAEPLVETANLSENLYFIVKQIPVTIFIEESFIKQFIKMGSLHALSHNARIGTENFITFLPSGDLFLYLENEIAESLALKKEISLEKKVKKQKLSFQTCKIQTKLPNFHCGEKLYDLVHQELNKLNFIKFDVLLKWKPQGNICPQSIRHYFEKKGYECITCEPSHANTTKISVPVPNMNLKELDSVEMEELIEWIGIQVCNISDFPDSDTDKLFSIKHEESSQIVEHLEIDFYQGFYDGEDVCSILKKSKDLLEKNPDMKFIIVFIKGYLDSYLARKKFEKFSSGNKIAALIISSNFQYFVTNL